MPEAKKLNIHQRMLAIAAAAPPVPKDKQVGGVGGGYKAQTYDSAITLFRQLFAEHGVVMENRVVSCAHSEYQTANGKQGYKVDVEMEVTFVNVDDPTDRYTCSGIGSGMDLGDKAPGKAYTYCRKYAILHALNAITGDTEEDRPDHEVSRERHTERPLGPPAGKNTDLITEKQIKMLNLKGKAVYGDQWDTFRRSSLAGKGIESSKDLTKSQAGAWIDQLIAKENAA